MTDVTNTGSTPVVPEAEMASIRQIFERAANAIVQASELSVKVNELQSRFASLEHDLESVRRRNAELDEALASVRASRDNALSDLNQAKASLNGITQDRDFYKSTVDSDALTIKDLREDVAHAKSESEGWMQAALKSDEELSQAKAKLAKLREAMGIEDKPEPQKPETVKVEPMPEPVAVSQSNDPYDGVDTSKAYHLDYILQRYIND